MFTTSPTPEPYRSFLGCVPTRPPSRTASLFNAQEKPIYRNVPRMGALPSDDSLDTGWSITAGSFLSVQRLKNTETRSVCSATRCVRSPPKTTPLTRLASYLKQSDVSLLVFRKACPGAQPRRREKPAFELALESPLGTRRCDVRVMKPYTCFVDAHGCRCSADERQLPPPRVTQARVETPRSPGCPVPFPQH